MEVFNRPFDLFRKSNDKFMKNIPFSKLAALLIICASSANAFEVKDLLGEWVGRRKETKNGTGTYANVRIVGKRLLDGSVQLVEKGYSPSMGQYTAKHTFHRGGKYNDIITSYGYIRSTSRGSWKLHDGKISISADGTSHSKGTVTQISEDQFKYVGTSDDIRLTINVHRR
jgi:hypothetical protein